MSSLNRVEMESGHWNEWISNGAHPNNPFQTREDFQNVLEHDLNQPLVVCSLLKS